MLTDEEAMELMAEDMSIDIPIKHKSNPYLMIPFSEGTTNGDVIKMLFPNIESWSSIEGDDTIFVNLKFEAKWWNAPYKKEG